MPKKLLTQRCVWNYLNKSVPSVCVWAQRTLSNPEQEMCFQTQECKLKKTYACVYGCSGWKQYNRKKKKTKRSTLNFSHLKRQSALVFTPVILWKKAWQLVIFGWTLIITLAAGGWMLQTLCFGPNHRTHTKSDTKCDGGKKKKKEKSRNSVGKKTSFYHMLNRKELNRME